MTEFPKWVLAYPSHIVGNAAPNFAHAFKTRDGAWMVLVETAEDEARAIAALGGPSVMSVPEIVKMACEMFVSDAPVVDETSLETK